ncbi:MAG TPA: glucosaminidase domain-containing protein [Steroidobacteraceae bacterium]|nr:glucosaminidase domain-containing protein [Steroidobacteraceae bacterium]
MTALLTPSSLPPASGTAATAADTYTDLNGLAALKSAPNSPASIRAVAEQVEALFLQMMLKSMRDAGTGDGVTDNNETDMYQDMFDKQVALTLSKRQDLGIARFLEGRLGEQSSEQSSSSSVPASAPAQLTYPPAASTAAPTGGAADEFVERVLPPIRRAARSLGINPAGLLAQAALETSWGQRMPRKADGSSSLNLFGVKAGEDWAGPRAVAESVEVDGGVATQRRTTFRAYSSIEESVEDFTRLLASSPRYQQALAAGDDAEAYVRRIGESGYATDPKYGDKLSGVLASGPLRSALDARVAKL